MRFRSWLTRLIVAFFSLFGVRPTLIRLPTAEAPRDLKREHLQRLVDAADEIRGHNRSRYAVIPPFHKVKGKTRAFRRPSYAGNR